MGAVDTCKRLRIRMTLAQRRACIYLERNGKRFMVDFGFQNARELARAHRRERREQRP